MELPRVRIALFHNAIRSAGSLEGSRSVFLSNAAAERLELLSAWVLANRLEFDQ
jgi:hypothetical protein